MYEEKVQLAKRLGYADSQILEELESEKKSIIVKSTINQNKVALSPNPYLRRALRRQEVECVAALNTLMRKLKEAIENGTTASS